MGCIARRRGDRREAIYLDDTDRRNWLELLGAVRERFNWRWSSYRAMDGDAAAPRWLETGWLLSQFGGRRRSAVRGYIDFVGAGVGDKCIWKQVSGLGSDTFAEKMKQQLPKGRDSREVPRAQRRPGAKLLSHYAAFGDRRDGMTQAYAPGGYMMREIADYFGVHYATVSRTVQAKRSSP